MLYNCSFLLLPAPTPATPANKQVCFVDLRPVPAASKPVSPAGFSVLLSMLTGADKLDGWELAHAVDGADLQTKVRKKQKATVL